MKWRCAILLWTALAVTSCDADSHESRVEGFRMDRARLDVNAVRHAMEDGGNPNFACAGILDVARLVAERGPAEKREAAQWDELCSLKAPSVYADTLLKRMTAARAQGREPAVDDCFDLDRTLDRLEVKHGEDAQVKAMRARRHVLCP